MISLQRLYGFAISHRRYVLVISIAMLGALVAHGFHSGAIRNVIVTLVFLSGIARYTLYRYSTETLPDDDSLASPSPGPRRQYWAAVLISAVLFTGFGLYHIAQQSLVDEPLWLYNRIPKYWKNLAERDWHGTRVSDKPGTTVALISGIGLFVDDNYTKYPLYKHYDYTQNGQHGLSIERFFAAHRIPLLIVAAISIIAFFVILRPLIGDRPAVFAALLIGTQPLLLGMSRIVNPDAILWIVAPMTLLSFTAALIAPTAQQRKRYVIATGGLFGAALLTKYVSNILLIALPMVIVLAALSARPSLPVLRRGLWAFLSTVVLALLVIVAVYPYTWPHPIDKLLKLTLFSQAFGKDTHTLEILIVGALVCGAGAIALAHRCARRRQCLSIAHLWATLQRTQLVPRIVALVVLLAFGGTLWTIATGTLDIASIMASPKSAYREVGTVGLLLAAPYPLLFGMTLPALTGSIIALLLLLCAPYRLSSRIRLTLTVIGVFSLLYALGSAINTVATPLRYLIMLFPLWMIVAAVGIHYALQQIRTGMIAVTLLIYGAAVLIWSAPHYFSYANPLLPQTLLLNYKDMGDGSYEAAQYLNALPNAESLVVWTDKRGVCRIFVGQCTSTLDFKRYIMEEWQPDYYIVSAGRKRKVTRTVQHKYGYNPRYLIRFDYLYNDDVPRVFEIHPARHRGNFIRIIRATDIDISHTQQTQ